jgi:hypothetical protein
MTKVSRPINTQTNEPIAVLPQKKHESILKFGLRAKGRVELEKLSRGQKLGPTRLILAKCYDCMCGYADGVRDCEDNTCPLYPFHPYNPNRSKKK